MASSFPSLSQPPSAFPMPSVAEDTLFYKIHIPGTEDAAATALLVSEFVSSLLPSPWLWNKDAWELKVLQDDGVGGPREALKDQHKLSGTMRVGDAVDDEWLVVWLLREVSRKWPEFVISLRDTDGEFLLIEAANELPSWVSPENAENRLWLSAGQLHLLPLSVRSSKNSVRFIPDDEALERQYDPEAQLSEEDAVKAVLTGRHQASQEVQGAIWDRISHYPAKMSDHLHHTKAYLPLPVARALSQNPSLVQKAVEGFYVRDPAQLRGAARMTHFPPSSAILAPVLLTRAAYAQLQGQVFHPPRVFGPEWHVRAAEEGNEQLEKERRWRDIGVKIATGFEIMYKEGGKAKRGEAASDEVPADDPDWQAYIARLRAADFFGGEVEGSQKWNERLQKALKGWREAVGSSDTAQFRPSFAYLVEDALTDASDDPTKLSAKPDDREDSDSWLEVSPDDLDAMLLKASGGAEQSSGLPEDASTAEPGDDADHPLKELAKKVEAFVGGQGDLQGARFADEFSDEEDDSDDEDDADDRQAQTRDEDEEMDVPADPWERMTPAEKEARMSSLVSALPIEEWGKKPDPPKKPTAPATASSRPAEASPSRAKMPSLFKQDFDGVESDSDSEEEEGDDTDLPAAGTLGRKIAQMRWSEGAPRIEEIDEDHDMGGSDGDGDGRVDDEDEEDRLDKERDASLRWDDNIDDAMRKRVWGDANGATGKGKKEDRPVVVNADEPAEEGEDGMEMDMENEMNDFLSFARETLGVGEDQWNGILQSRQDRGAFVPAGGNAPTLAAPQSAKSAPTPTPPATTAPRAEDDPDMTLDSFEKVMAAMDSQLAAKRQQPTKSTAPLSTGKAATAETGKRPSQAPLPPLPTEADLEALSEDDLAQMDRELREALKGAGIDDDDEDDYDADLGDLDPAEARELKGDQRQEYRMMRDFLESYRSQGGQGGAVGNLFGRLAQESKGGK